MLNGEQIGCLPQPPYIFTTVACRHLTRVDLIYGRSAPSFMPQSADLGPQAALPKLHTLHLEGLQLQCLQARLHDRIYKCIYSCLAWWSQRPGCCKACM